MLLRQRLFHPDIHHGIHRYCAGGIEVFQTDNKRSPLKIKFMEVGGNLIFEKSIVDNGIRLIKLWFEIDKETQTKRFKARIKDPRKQWKLSPMDLESHRRWYDYSRARDAMFEASHSPHAPWHIIDANDKKSARLNAISFILSQFPYEQIQFEKPKLPNRQKSEGYTSPDWSTLYVPKVYDFSKGK